MILITSGAYISDELQSTFGKIPPSFLPVKNTRLFVLQSEFFGKGKKKFISLPEDFIVDEKDEKLLFEHNFKKITFPSKASLGELITYIIINYIENTKTLSILLGDTYFLTIPEMEPAINFFSVSNTIDFYNWARIEGESNTSLTYSGYFHFTNSFDFLMSLSNCNYNFERALNHFKNQNDVQLKQLDDWLDFGHSNTYFRSKSYLSSERSFNKLSLSNMTYKKTSVQRNKILAEAQWFEELPVALRIHTPHYLGRINLENISGYNLEYLMNATLSELYVFGKLPLIVWDGIIDDALCLLEKIYLCSNDLPYSNLSGQIIKKTELRIKNLSDLGIDFNAPNVYNFVELPSFNEILIEVSEILDSVELNESIIHGDYCFSNILYVFNAQIIKVIDPRGLDLEGNVSNKGSLLYDLGKFFHSVIGLYDFIVCSYYQLKVDQNNFEFHIYIDESILQIQKSFLDKKFNGISMNDSFFYALNIHLFLSMIPLHSEDQRRQHAFLANALRLYIDLKSK
jgi:hypothetical protein